MENVTFSEEQFAKFIETIRPGPGLSPYEPDEQNMLQQVASELLQLTTRYNYGSAEKMQKLTALRDQIRSIAKEYL